MPILEDLEVRRAPVQDRSRKRVNKILEVTAELVAELGVDGVKTSEVARRAGIKLASLYRYFPNKNAILKSLAEHQFEKLRPKMNNFLDNFNIEDGLEALFDTYLDFYTNEPGYSQLWSGIQAIPELNQLDQEDLHQTAEIITAKVAPMMPHLTTGEIRAIATVVARSAGSILRLSLTTPEPLATQMITEVKMMTKAYLRVRLVRTP